MVTQQAQIKITLPVQLLDFLESKARRFGLPVAAYLRHLVVKDVEDMEYPVFQASKRVEKAYKKAMADYKSGKFVRVGNLDEYFSNLGK